jgi:hypothetical protein
MSAESNSCQQLRNFGGKGGGTIIAFWDGQDVVYGRSWITGDLPHIKQVVDSTRNTIPYMR